MLVPETSRLAILVHVIPGPNTNVVDKEFFDVTIHHVCVKRGVLVED